MGILLLFDFFIILAAFNIIYKLLKMSLSLHDTVVSVRTTAVDVTILKPQIPQIVNDLRQKLRKFIL